MLRVIGVDPTRSCLHGGVAACSTGRFQAPDTYAILCSTQYSDVDRSALKSDPDHVVVSQQLDVLVLVQLHREGGLGGGGRVRS